MIPFDAFQTNGSLSLNDTMTASSYIRFDSLLNGLFNNIISTSVCIASNDRFYNNG
jgi:hypothetical protein